MKKDELTITNQQAENAGEKLAVFDVQDGAVDTSCQSVQNGVCAVSADCQTTFGDGCNQALSEETKENATEEAKTAQTADNEAQADTLSLSAMIDDNIVKKPTAEEKTQEKARKREEARAHIAKDLIGQKSFAKNVGLNSLAKLKESLFSVLPVMVIVLIFALTPITDFSKKEIVTFVVSAIFLILGIALFNVGAGLTKSKKLPLLLGVGFIMGLLITVAEPDLSVLAEQVSAVMNNVVLIVTVGVGVGIFLVISIAKIVFRKDLSSLLLFFYMVLFALCAIMMENGKSIFVPLAFDSGGVTTGPITVPFIMALGVGVALNTGGRNAKENSFGLIALCSIGPMLAVMALSLASKGDLSYTLPDYSVDANLGANFGSALGGVALEVLIALGLIVVFFVILQCTILKLPKQKIIQIAIGIVFTYVGLVVFLTSVTVGFMPIGFKLGQEIASYSKPLLIVFAFVIGFVVVLAAPAVHVLNKQVEEITNGAVSKRSMLVALSIGVGLSIGLSVIRIIYGFSLLYYLIPGYLISLGLSFFVPKIYTAIAFDSGGVASGPLTSSFILPLAIGACSALWGDAGQVLNLAFGIVAMVAMTPLITIQLLGFRAITSAKVKEKIVMKRILDADDEQIIDFM